MLYNVIGRMLRRLRCRHEPEVATATDTHTLIQPTRVFVCVCVCVFVICILFGLWHNHDARAPACSSSKGPRGIIYCR